MSGWRVILKAIPSILKEISEEEPFNLRYPEWILFGLAFLGLVVLMLDPFQ